MKVILFHMRGCPHCIEQEKEYPDLYFNFSSKIERKNMSDSHKKYGVKSFPTIIFTRDDGILLGKLEGKKTAKQINKAYTVYKKSEQYM